MFTVNVAKYLWLHTKYSQYNFGLIQGDLYATCMLYFIATLQPVKKVVMMTEKEIFPGK